MDTGASEIPKHGEIGTSGATIEIKIKTMDSQTYSLRVDKQLPVPALKEQIATVTGIVTEHQRLICRGKVLKDDQLLSAYHVEDGHTLHLVVREPASTSWENIPADSDLNQSPGGSRGQFYQVAPGIVVETFNMPGQSERGLPDISRLISAVLGSIGFSSGVNSSEGTGSRDQAADRPAGRTAADTPQTQGEQSGARNNAFGIPGAVSLGSLQAPVIPDALTTLSQYLTHMRQEFINNGGVSEVNIDAAPANENEGGSIPSDRPESTQHGLPSPASLAELLSSTRQMLNQQTEDSLIQLARVLENQANMTDSGARASAQAGALRTGVLLQNLGAYFFELGRTVTTLRLGGSPSEAVVNAGPAVFISASGPNPIMVQPLPFQPGASFSSPLSGTSQSGSGASLFSGLGSGFVPRRIDIQIRRVGSSGHQTEQTGSQQPSGQRHPSTNGSGDTPTSQRSSGTSDAASLNGGPAVRILPFRSVTAAIPDLNRLPSESRGGSLGILYPFLGSAASGRLSGRVGNTFGEQPNGIQAEPRNSPGSAPGQQSVDAATGNGQDPAFSLEQEPIASRTIDINIFSSGGVQTDQNPEGQFPSGILQLLRRLFPNGEFQVDNDSSQGVTTESEVQPGDTAAEESEPRATEEGVFLSRLLQQIMPIISQVADAHPTAVQDGSQGRDDSNSSDPAHDPEVGTSRRQADADLDPAPNSKRQKRE